MLVLHSRVARTEAIGAFGPPRRDYCQGQFTSTATDLVCLFEPKWAMAVSPTSVRWVPEAKYEVNKWSLYGPPTWLPTAPDGRYRLFLRERAAEKYIYLGPAHLGAHATGLNPWAIFELEHKLPKADWLELGGDDGWGIRGDVSARLLPADLDEFDALLDGDGSGHLHIALTRYEGDELTLITNHRRALLRYNGRRATGELPREDAPEIFWSSHRRLDFCAPAEATLSKKGGLAATRHLFACGQIPEWLSWEEFGDGDEWLFREIRASLRHLFGYSLVEADALFEKYMGKRKQWQGAHGGQFHNDEYINHEGPENMAYVIQWSAGLGEEPGSLAFSDWRNADYERRRAAAR